jgi:hypothetical protein
MRWILLLLACSCYPLRNARIIDGTENDRTVWICVPDDQEPLNVGGLMCADMRAVLEQPR